MMNEHGITSLELAGCNLHFPGSIFPGDHSKGLEAGEHVEVSTERKELFMRRKITFVAVLKIDMCLFLLHRAKISNIGEGARVTAL